ncbi:two pore domain potassium channel family protein [Paenibacillus sonchi]|uniref:Two pore domain potassium channel family protein n=1 Tax=Paenibacillus sonchi TaxID=373687 RepID=A0A974PDY4_9BACL|nr:potassium channel family protein [Paenibacillus sonchi]MCE3202995.1 two pore domain potassium channel family protein [Paenibacillus sonchi]QQZ61746.1 two pore domain potassium channel family protein [Paenibacillus sonchi]
MTWWMWTLNIAVIVLLSLWLYRMKLSWMGKGVLLAPILIYALISVEDLLNWIDLGAILPGDRGLRGLILIFALASMLFYVLFIFHEIKESNSKEVRLQQTLVRISIAAFSCIIFFTVVYTSIYKLFGQSSFDGKGLGEDLLSQLITFLYFSVATFTTVGYGDVAPVDNTSRLVVIMQISFSFITVAYALSMLGLFRKILGPGSEEEVEAEIDVNIETEVDEKIEEAKDEVQSEECEERSDSSEPSG